MVWSQLALGLVLVGVSRTLLRCQEGSFRNEGLRSGWATQPSQTWVVVSGSPPEPESALTLVLKGLVTADTNSRTTVPRTKLGSPRQRAPHVPPLPSHPCNSLPSHVFCDMIFIAKASIRNTHPNSSPQTNFTSS